MPGHPPLSGASGAPGVNHGVNLAVESRRSCGKGRSSSSRLMCSFFPRKDSVLTAPSSRRRPRAIGILVLCVIIAMLGGYQFGLKRLPSTDPAALDELDAQMFDRLHQQYA